MVNILNSVDALDSEKRHSFLWIVFGTVVSNFPQYSSINYRLFRSSWDFLTVLLRRCATCSIGSNVRANKYNIKEYYVIVLISLLNARAEVPVGTLSKTKPSTLRDDQFFQLISVAK